MEIVETEEDGCESTGRHEPADNVGIGPGVTTEFAVCRYCAVVFHIPTNERLARTEGT